MILTPAVASASLGNAYVHSIQEKLKQAAQHGFKLIEIVEDDILAQTKNEPDGPTDEN